MASKTGPNLPADAASGGAVGGPSAAATLEDQESDGARPARASLAEYVLTLDSTTPDYVEKIKAYAKEEEASARSAAEASAGDATAPPTATYTYPVETANAARLRIRNERLAANELLAAARPPPIVPASMHRLKERAAQVLLQFTPGKPKPVPPTARVAAATARVADASSPVPTLQPKPPVILLEEESLQLDEDGYTDGSPTPERLAAPPSPHWGRAPFDPSLKTETIKGTSETHIRTFIKHVEFLLTSTSARHTGQVHVGELLSQNQTVAAQLAAVMYNKHGCVLEWAKMSNPDVIAALEAMVPTDKKDKDTIAKELSRFFWLVSRDLEKTVDAAAALLGAIKQELRHYDLSKTLVLKHLVDSIEWYDNYVGVLALLDQFDLDLKHIKGLKAAEEALVKITAPVFNPSVDVTFKELNAAFVLSEEGGRDGRQRDYNSRALLRLDRGDKRGSERSAISRGEKYHERVSNAGGGGGGGGGYPARAHTSSTPVAAARAPAPPQATTGYGPGFTGINHAATPGAARQDARHDAHGRGHADGRDTSTTRCHACDGIGHRVATCTAKGSLFCSICKSKDHVMTTHFNGFSSAETRAKHEQRALRALKLFGAEAADNMTTPIPYAARGSVNGERVTLIWDTGAHVSAINMGTLKRVAPGATRKPSAFREVKLANGDVVRTHGLVTLDYTVMAHIKRHGDDVPEVRRFDDTITFLVIEGDNDAEPLLISATEWASDTRGTSRLWKLLNEPGTSVTYSLVGAVTSLAVKEPLGSSGAHEFTPVIDGDTLLEKHIVSTGGGENALLATALGPDARNTAPLTAALLRSHPGVSSTDFPAYADELVKVLLKRKAVQEMSKFSEGAKVPTYHIELTPAAKQMPPIKHGTGQVTPPKLREAAMAAVNDMIALGIVELVPAAEKSFQYVLRISLVKKANGDLRFVQDCRDLNDRTVAEETVLPNQGEIPRQHIGNRAFTSMDLARWFSQVLITPESARYLGFMVNGNMYRVVRGPMGHVNMPGFAQNIVNVHLIAPLRESLAAHGSTLTVFVDDLVLSTSGGSDVAERHLASLDLLLGKLESLNILVGAGYNKCVFMTSEVRTLGVIFDGYSWRLDPARLDGLRDLRAPVNPDIHDVRRMLGLLSYYTQSVCLPEYNAGLRILQNVATLAASTGYVSRGGASHWKPEHDVVLARMRDLVVTAAALPILDYSKRLYVYTDASTTGCGAMATQVGADGKERVVFIFRHEFTGPEKDMKVNDKEAFAVMIVVRKFNVLLAKIEWVLCTDSKNLVNWSTCESLLIRRWFLEASHTCHWVQHLAGKANVVADALSRIIGRDLPATDVVSFPEYRYPTVRPKLAAVIVEDIAMGEEEAAAPTAPPFTNFAFGGAELLNDLRQFTWDKIIAAQELSPGLAEKPGVARRKFIKGWALSINEKIIIPASAPELITATLCAAHEACGHGGRDVTLQHLSDVHIDGLAARVTAHVESCMSCKRAKARPPRPAGTISPHVVTAPGQTVQVDIEGPFPITPAGYVAVVTIVCSATRYLSAYPVKDLTAASAVAAMEDYVARFKCPPLIVQTDGGSHFKGVFDAYCERHGITHHVTTPYRPQSNGIVERQHGVIRTKLATYLTDATVNRWADMLPHVVVCINTSRNRSIGMSPHEARYGSVPSNPIRVALGIESVVATPEELAIVRHKAMVHAAKSAARETDIYAGKFKAARVYDIGDTVLRLYDSRPNKLTSWARGPYQIIKQDDDNSNFYVISIMDGGALPQPEIRVHVTQITPVDMTRTTLATEELRVKGPEHFTVDAIVRHFAHDTYTGELVFEVKWGDGDIGAAQLEDLMGNGIFSKYISEHDIAIKTLNKQRKAERKRAAAVAAAFDASSAAATAGSEAIMPDGKARIKDKHGTAGETPVRPAVAHVPARARELHEADKEPVVGFPSDSKFKFNDRVTLRSSAHVATVISILHKTGGEYRYALAFDGHGSKKAPLATSQGYGESAIMLFTSKRKSAPSGRGATATH